MKRSDFKDKSSVLFIGKGIIILSLVIASSLSFILGFFVGKSYNPALENQISAIPPQESDIAKDRAIVNSETTVQQQPANEIQTTPIPPETQKTGQTNQTQETKAQEGTKKQSEVQQKKEPLNQAQVKESAKLKADHKTNESKDQGTSKTRKYTIQAGAFKNEADADSLKAKLDKKGYKTFVIPFRTKKHEKLFKVMVGEFSTRKEADFLSIKLKKTEGLKTFVTFKP